MSSAAVVTTQANGQSGRARGGRRGRGGRGGKTRGQGGQSAPVADQAPLQETQEQKADTPATDAEVDDGDLCWICAEQVKYWSVSPCNHRTCHTCALRLRALYKKMECTFCKEPQPALIFTTSPDALWSTYTPEQLEFKDAKLSISFESKDMMDDTFVLLRFNCPDSECPYAGTGWNDLKLHVNMTHGKHMCDLCIKNKKCFAHEHVLYDRNQLMAHLPSMARGNRDTANKGTVEGGVHPLCRFCRDCFFGDDELYAHLRERHEDCFVCKRNDVRDQYFQNYAALEDHFMNAHFPCKHPQCLARKFVVFGSAIDLKAHMVEEHGAEMSARDKRDAMRVEAAFEFEEVGVGGHGHGGGGRRGQRDREREREPPPGSAAAVAAASGSRAQTAGARRREAFGGNLTADSPLPPSRSSQSLHPAQSQQPSRGHSPSQEDPDAERFATLVGRLNGLAPNPVTAVPAVKSAIRSFRSNESSARDLISTVWTILDRNLDGTASIVNAAVDILEDEEKKQALLSAWNSFKIEQRNQFPELVPTSQGTEWAGIASGRVLNAKNSAAARSSAQSSRQVLDRVARAAASSSVPGSGPPAPRAVERFPPLAASSSAASSSATSTPLRKPGRNTPWTQSAAAAPSPPSTAVMRGPTSVPGPGANSRKAAPALSKSAFPELPTSSAPRVPKGAIGGNQSLRNILGDATPAVPAWGTGGGGSGSSTPGEGAGEVAGESAPAAGGKGKKGKGKQKQTLFTLGSFPS